jgi:hypothetical protein
MKARIPLLISSGLYVLLLLAVSVGFMPAKVRAQGNSILDDLGSKKNGPEDIANSLIPAPPKYGKREKKEQIDATQLKSKSIKDSTFGGSLLNTGIGGSEPKLDEKVHGAPVAKDTSVSAQPAASKEEAKASSETHSAEKQPSFLDLSQTATLAQALDEPGDVSGTETKTTTRTTNGAASGNNAAEAQKKNQSESTTAPATATGEQTSTSSTEKPSPSKRDGGDH